MNIEGFKTLIAYGFPTPDIAEFFHHPTELDWVKIEAHAAPGSRFLVLGFDTRCSIYDHPYEHRGVKRAGISKETVEAAWLDISRQLTNSGVNSERQLYLLLEQYTEKTILASGMASMWADAQGFGQIAVEVAFVSREPGGKWEPDYAVYVPVIDSRPSWSQARTTGEADVSPRIPQVASRVIRDLRRIDQNPSLDFVIMLDGRLVYHDLCESQREAIASDPEYKPEGARF